MSLPNGWTKCLLGDYLFVKNGFAFKSKDYIEEGIPVVRISDIKNQKVSSIKSVKVAEKNVPNGFDLEYGDLLIAMSGATTGKTGVFLENSYVVQNQRVGNIKLRSMVNGSTQFRNYLIQGLTPIIFDLAYGGAQPNISPTVLENIEILLPPINEQKRIAKRLDELLATVESIKTHLDNAPSIIKRFRQSILSSATSGKLTEGWREENRGVIKTLIEDITTSWINIHQEDKKKYQKPKLEATHIEYDDLPKTWNKTQLGYVFDVYVGATPSRKNEAYWNGDIPWVSSGEVAFNVIDKTKERITEEGLNNTSTNLHPVGTILLAMIGQGKTRGQPAILEIEACHNQNTAALRVNNKYSDSKYLYYYLWERYEKTREVGSGNNQKALNKKAVQTLPFPLPPLAEQKEIVSQVEYLFTLADTLEEKIEAAKKRVDKLTQSILAKAFKGELVPQDPNDEPAEKLLERIKAEKEKPKKTRKKK